MRILQFIYDLGSGGAEKFIVTLSNELAEQGHDVILLQLLDDRSTAGNFNRQFLSDKVKYINGGLSKGFSLSKVRHICKLVKNEKPDVVHGHLNVMPYVWPLVLSNKNKIRFVHTLHNLAQYTAGSRFQKPINRFLYSHKYIQPVTISGLCHDSYHRFYSLQNDIHIDNGTAEVETSPRFEEVSEEIRKLKRTRDTKVFIHVGRFNPQKNQKLLIESFNNIKKENADAILLIIGRDFDTEGGKHLKEIAHPDIHFLGEKNNVGDYLLNSDFFSLSSTYEGLPISILEAFSAGVTPVCTPVGGIPDVITDGVNGYLSEDCTLENYTNAMRRAIDNPISSEEMIKIFEEGYSMKKCADKYLSVYKSEPN